MRVRRHRARSHRARLGELEASLDASAPAVREVIEQLVDADAVVRARALDAISDLLLRSGARAALVLDAIPFVIALATSRGYPEGSALLVRIAALVANEARAPSIDDALRAAIPQLLHLARTSSDPEAARVAACIASRFADAHRDVEPILIALLSGARDAVERARVLYALTRIQAARGGDFHGRIAEVLHRESVDAESIAVALVLADHDPPEPLRARIARTLLAARERSFPDPRAWGRTLDPEVLDRALAKLDR